MTPENITLLQALIQADPALSEQLQNAASIDTASQLLAQAANQKDIVVDAADISKYSDAAKDATLADVELEAIAGGKWHGFKDVPTPVGNPSSILHYNGFFLVRTKICSSV